MNLDTIKNIIKNTYVNFLFGAGTSYNKVNSKTHYPLMSDLYKYCISDENINEYIKYFKKPSNHQRNIVANIIDKYLFKCDNIELFLSVIEGINIYLEDEEVILKVIDFINEIKKCIFTRIINSDNETVIKIYENFYRSLKTLKEQTSITNQSFNIFTTNYDMMNEIAMEKINTHYYSGFNGIVNRQFNISYYNSRFMNTYTMKGSNFSLNDNHINLYKLHGSISWKYENDLLLEVNPYEIKNYSPEIIYPSIAKFKNTNMVAHYASLMREFSNKICQKNTCLIVNGTSLNDEHINIIIDNALLINSFTLIVFPCGDSLTLKSICDKYDNHKNVIVYDKSTTFENLSDILNDILGEKNESI